MLITLKNGTSVDLYSEELFRCDHCGIKVYYGKTTAGKRVPIDKNKLTNHLDTCPTPKKKKYDSDSFTQEDFMEDMKDDVHFDRSMQ